MQVYCSLSKILTIAIQHKYGYLPILFIWSCQQRTLPGCYKGPGSEEKYPKLWSLFLAKDYNLAIFMLLRFIVQNQKTLSQAIACREKFEIWNLISTVEILSGHGHKCSIDQGLYSFIFIGNGVEEELDIT